MSPSTGRAVLFVLLGVLAGMGGMSLVVAGSNPRPPAVQYSNITYDAQAAASLCPGDTLPYTVTVAVKRADIINWVSSYHRADGEVVGIGESGLEHKFVFTGPGTFTSSDAPMTVPLGLEPGIYKRNTGAGTTNNTAVETYSIHFSVRQGCDE